MDKSDNNEKMKTSAFVKAAVGLMITAILDHLVSFSTAYWVTWTSPERKQHGGYGLWKLWRCSLDENTNPQHVIRGFGISPEFLKEKMGCEVKMADSSFPAWYVSCQVLQTISLGAVTTSMVLLFVYIYVPRWSRSQAFVRTIIALTYLAGIFTAVSVSVFGIRVADELVETGVGEWALSWSFSLSCTSCLLVQIAASVLVHESKRLAKVESGKVSSDDDEDDGTLLPVSMNEHRKLLKSQQEYFDDANDDYEVDEMNKRDLTGIVTTA